MENTEKIKNWGFKKGLNAVYNNCTAAQYSKCLAETEKLNEVFASYGVTDWHGIE